MPDPLQWNESGRQSMCLYASCTVVRSPGVSERPVTGRYLDLVVYLSVPIVSAPPGNTGQRLEGLEDPSKIRNVNSNG